MNLAETARVLALVQAYDNRNVDELVVSAWHSTLADLGFDDCCTAVREYFARHGAWLMPDSIREGVMRIRRARLDAVVEPVPNVDPDRPLEFAAAVRETRRQIADGQPPPRERLRLEGSRGLPHGFVETFRDVREQHRPAQIDGPTVTEAELLAEQQARAEIARLHQQAQAADEGPGAMEPSQ